MTEYEIRAIVKAYLPDCEVEFGPMPAGSPRRAVALASIRTWGGKRVITFVPRVLAMSEDVQRRVIFHEIAHHALQHDEDVGTEAERESAAESFGRTLRQTFEGNKHNG